MFAGVETQAVVLSVIGVIAIIGIAFVIIGGAMYFNRQEHAETEDHTAADKAEEHTTAAEPAAADTDSAEEEAEEPESATPAG